MPRIYRKNQDLESAPLRAHNLWNSHKERHLIRDWAHWRGYGRWVDDGYWRGEGERIRNIFSILSTGLDAKGPRPGRMLEWGTGGGCNVTAFGELTKEIVGVDISAETLVQCRLEMQKMQPDVSFLPYPIALDCPEDTLTLGKFDFILCVAVTQHMPSHKWFWNVVDIWRELLEEGGLLMVEFRTRPRAQVDNPAPEVYDENVNRWTTFEDDQEVITQLPRHGFKFHRQYHPEDDKSHRYVMAVAV